MSPRTKAEAETPVAFARSCTASSSLASMSTVRNRRSRNSGGRPVRVIGSEPYICSLTKSTGLPRGLEGEESIALQGESDHRLVGLDCAWTGRSRTRAQREDPPCGDCLAQRPPRRRSGIRTQRARWRVSRRSPAAGVHWCGVAGPRAGRQRGGMQPRASPRAALRAAQRGREPFRSRGPLR
jgi:hypothetical protein